MITYPNLYHLRYFVDAATLGSVSAAAQKNLVTHPAISRAISALELHLGTTLLVHKKKSFKLTEAGYRVAEHAAILLKAATDFRTLKSKTENVQPAELKIGISRTLAEVYLSPLLRDVKTKFPALTAKIRLGTSHEIIEAVANGTVDIGITIGSINLPTLKQNILKKGKFVLVESGLHKKTKKNLSTRSFIITEPRLETEKLKSFYKKRFNRTLPILFEVSSWDVILHLVQQGHGIGLVPDIAINKSKII